MRVLGLLLLSLLLLYQSTFFAFASGVSKVTTFHLSQLCDIVVHFSCDSDAWRIGEKHEIGFTFIAMNINPNVVELSLSINKIVVRFKEGTLYIHTIDLISIDLSNQITQLVWRQNSITILNTPRSFAYEIEVPKPDKHVNEDTNVKLYYLVQLRGNYYYQDAYSRSYGNIYEHISNEGTMSGGIEDPVWITIKAEAISPWVYVAFVLVGTGIAATSILVVRHRKLRKTSKKITN